MTAIRMAILILLSWVTLLTPAYASEEYLWVQNILNSDDSVETTEETNEQQIKEADNLINAGSVNPVVFYLRGAFGSGRQYFYYKKLLKEGEPYRLNAPENQALIKEYQSYYLKAMELDENPDAPDHLTGLMLSAIGTDTVGDPTIKARALKKAGDLAREGKDGTGHEPFEWNTYEARLSIYNEARDFDNFMKTLNEMMERFGNSANKDALEEYKRQALQEIASWSGQAQSVIDSQDAYTAIPPQPAQAKAAEVKKAELPTAEVSDHSSESDNNLWLLLGGVFVLLGLFGFYMNRRKKS